MMMMMMMHWSRLNHPTSVVPTPPSTSLTFSRVAPPLFGLRYQANGETAAPNASKEEKTQLGHPSFRDMQWTWGLAYCNYMVRFGHLHEFGRFWKFECAVVLGEAEFGIYQIIALSSSFIWRTFLIHWFPPSKSKYMYISYIRHLNDI